MGIVPENVQPRIAWYRAHLAPWAEHAAELGLPAEQVALLEDKVALAAEQLARQRAAHEAAKTATASLHEAMTQLSELGSKMIQTIRARAANDGQGVYSKAMIPAPAAPSPIAVPGTPTKFTFHLRQVGDIDLRWKCPNPKGSEGTMYEIKRQLGNGPFVIVGIVGKKRFYDDTVPAGTARVTYRVTAFRSTRRGECANFTIFLGVDGIITEEMKAQADRQIRGVGNRAA
jgi:hypothetical protein